MPRDLFDGALRDDPATVPSRSRPHVDDLVGRPHGVLVVLDDDYGVADVPEMLKRANESAVVPLMQSDRRLVENIANAHKPAAYLSREAYAVGLSARQRRRRAVERYVVESNVGQEGQPMSYLFQDRMSDLCLLGVQREFAEETHRLIDGHARDFIDALAPHRHRKGGRLESGAFAGRARLFRHEAVQTSLDEFAVRLAPSSIQVGDNALPLGVCLAIHQLLADRGRDLIIGRRRGDAVVGGRTA